MVDVVRSRENGILGNRKRQSKKKLGALAATRSKNGRTRVTSRRLKLSVERKEHARDDISTRRFLTKKNSPSKFLNSHAWPKAFSLSLSLVGETRGASLGAFNSSLVRGSVGGV